MSLLSANDWLVAVNSETTWGTDAYAGADPTEFMAFEEFTFNPEIMTVPDEAVRATHSGREHDAYGGKTSLSWRHPITGIVDPSGTPSFPMGSLFKASNFAETVAVTPSYEYNMVTGDSMTEVPSATFVHYLLQQDRAAARKFVFSGMRGNTTLSMTMGEPVRLSGDMVGSYTAFPSATVAMPSNPTSYAGEANRFVMLGAVIEVGGVSYDVESFETSTGWTIGEEHDGTTANTTLGLTYLTRGVDARPSGSLTLKGKSAVLSAIISQIQTKVTFAFSAVLVNANGDRITVTAPSLQFGSYTANFDGNINFDLPFFLNGTGAGENEILLKVDRA